MTLRIKTIWNFCKELGPLGPLLLFAVAAPGIGVIVLLSTNGTWLPWMRELGSQQIPAFLILTILLVGLSLVPTHASSLISGMLFGVIWGPVYALIAVVISAFFAFKLMSFIIKDNAYDALLKRPNATEIHEELLNRSGSRAVFFICLIRLSPVMPFAGTNLLLAASKVKTSYFLLGSLIGLAPRVIIVAVAGAGLEKLDLTKSSNIWMAVFGAVSTIALIAIIGRVVRKVYQPKQKEDSTEEVESK